LVVDASAPQAVLQFISSGMSRVALPATIHCDHLIEGKNQRYIYLRYSYGICSGSTAGSKTDLKRGIDENKELFDFLGSAASKFGIGLVHVYITIYSC